MIYTLYGLMVDFFRYMLHHYTDNILDQESIEELHNLGLPIENMKWSRKYPNKSFNDIIDGDLLETVGSATPLSPEWLAEAFLKHYGSSVDAATPEKAETPYHFKKKLLKAQKHFNKFATNFIMYKIRTGNIAFEVSELNKTSWADEILRYPIIERKYAKYSLQTFKLDKDTLTFQDLVFLRHLIRRVLKEYPHLSFAEPPTVDDDAAHLFSQLN